MSLNDREKFIMHMVTVMVLATTGDPIDILKVQKEVLKNRCRKLTDKQVFNLWEDLKEEVLNGRSLYEEMVSVLGKDKDMFKNFGGKFDV